MGKSRISTPERPVRRSPLGGGAPPPGSPQQADVVDWLDGDAEPLPFDAPRVPRIVMNFPNGVPVKVDLGV
jgi:hypothetical protein